MKKILSLILVLIAVLGLEGCNNPTSEITKTTTSTTTVSTDPNSFLYGEWYAHKGQEYLDEEYGYNKRAAKLIFHEKGRYEDEYRFGETEGTYEVENNLIKLRGKWGSTPTLYYTEELGYPMIFRWTDSPIEWLFYYRDRETLDKIDEDRIETQKKALELLNGTVWTATDKKNMQYLRKEDFETSYKLEFEPEKIIFAFENPNIKESSSSQRYSLENSRLDKNKNLILYYDHNVIVCKITDDKVESVRMLFMNWKKDDPWLESHFYSNDYDSVPLEDTINFERINK